MNCRLVDHGHTIHISPGPGPAPPLDELDPMRDALRDAIPIGRGPHFFREFRSCPPPQVAAELLLLLDEVQLPPARPVGALADRRAAMAILLARGRRGPRGVRNSLMPGLIDLRAPMPTCSLLHCEKTDPGSFVKLGHLGRG